MVPSVVVIAEVVPPRAAKGKGSWLGSMAGTAEILGDVVRPVVAAEEWDALRK